MGGEVMSDINYNVNIDDKLYLNSYIVDTESHLKIIDQSVCEKCEDKPCLIICPAKVYEEKDNHTHISYEGCLECGACRIACVKGNIDWRYPKGGFGVQFRLA